MRPKPACMTILLRIGVVLFFLTFLGSTIVPERVLPALGFASYNGFIIRLYGIFQLSWVILLFFAQKDVERNRAIIDAALITGASVVAFFVVYQFAVIKSGGYLLVNAALVFIYTALIFLCRPKPPRR